MDNNQDQQPNNQSNSNQPNEQSSNKGINFFAQSTGSSDHNDKASQPKPPEHESGASTPNTSMPSGSSPSNSFSSSSFGTNPPPPTNPSNLGTMPSHTPFIQNNPPPSSPASSSTPNKQEPSTPGHLPSFGANQPSSMPENPTPNSHASVPPSSTPSTPLNANSSNNMPGSPSPSTQHGFGNVINANKMPQPQSMPSNASVNPSAFSSGSMGQPQFNQMPQSTMTSNASSAPAFKQTVKPGQYPGQKKMEVKPRRGLPWLIFVLAVILVVTGTGYYVLFYKTGAAFNIPNLMTTIQNQIDSIMGRTPEPQELTLPEFSETDEGKEAAINTPPVEEDPELDVLTPGNTPSEIMTDLDKTDLNKMDVILQEIQ